MRKFLLSAAIMAAAALTSNPAAADEAALKAQAGEHIKVFFAQLKDELEAGMKSGGPAGAIGACHDQAPKIAVERSTDGWTVGRTSLKLRSPDNAPDAWEQAVLEQFDARKAKGENPAEIVYAEVVDEGGAKVFRFMKAIPTADLCLTCHGSEIGAEVAATLDELYPKDAARGYGAGDIRGAFTLRKPL